MTVTVPFDWVKPEHQSAVIYATLVANKEILMSLQDQIATLTNEVAGVKGDLATLTAAVDAEQAQVAAALALLSADNPDVAAAITTLQEARATIAAVKADVESTIPDTP